jgi:hypothetical protein
MPSVSESESESESETRRGATRRGAARRSVRVATAAAGRAGEKSGMGPSGVTG